MRTHNLIDAGTYNNLHNNPLWNNRVQANNRVGPGPKLGPNLDFFKLVDLEIWGRGPWLKNSEPSYVSSYGPGRFSCFLDQNMRQYLGPGYEAVPGTRV